MNQSLRTLVVTPATKIEEVLHNFVESETDLLLIDEDSVVADPHMELLTDYPRSASAALVAAEKDGDTLVRQNRIASATSASHKVTIGNRKFLGVLRVSQKQRDEVIGALENAISFNPKGNAIDLVLVALTRAMIKVDAAEAWAAPCGRTSKPAEREKIKSEIAALNMGRVRLRMANRATDGFFSVFFLRKFSKLGTWLAVKLGATPNQVTLISFAIGLYSAYNFAQGTFWSIFLGAVLLQVSIIVDCVDGELARYTRQFSQLGAWLDAVTDRVKEYMVFLGLAIGAEKEGRDLWIPAIVMMLIQTFRHLSDYNFARVVKIQAEEKFNVPVDFMAEFDGIIPTEREPKGRLRFWLGKVIQFPIGERWLAISASAVIGGAAFTFTIMPVLAFISAIWVYRGRIIRTLTTMPKEFLKQPLIVDQSDLFGLKRTITTRFSWIEPSVLRALEIGFLTWIFASADKINTASYMIIFAIVFHHYDSLYRALQNEKKPTWLSALGLFVGGRILLLGIAAQQDWPLDYLAWYFGVLFLGISSLQWVLSHKAHKIRK
ncbi:MAG: CDP-alcohol phosphatidyltransferase family protein [Candidatus Nanopelagicaceae bacterium]|nr:CDP-alcohol phosphatidyltransferase family protein [Candidatus Nanopelagicaceae bacterium]